MSFKKKLLPRLFGACDQAFNLTIRSSSRLCYDCEHRELPTSSHLKNHYLEIGNGAEKNSTGDHKRVRFSYATKPIYHVELECGLISILNPTSITPFSTRAKTKNATSYLEPNRTSAETYRELPRATFPTKLYNATIYKGTKVSSTR